jgi:small-conductance mechanosensitive channel
MENVARAVLANVYQVRIAEAVDAYREERTPKALLFDGVYTLVATLVAAAAVIVVLFVLRRLTALLEERYRGRIEELEIKAVSIVTAKQMWDMARGSIRIVRVLSVFAIILLYLNFVLGLYPWTRSLANRLAAVIVDPLSTIATAFVQAIPNLIFLAILFFITRYALKLGRLFFDAIAGQRVRLPNFDPDWAWPTYRIARLLVVVFAVVVAYPYIPGSDTDAFKGISIFLGVIFSLGSSTVIANLIAGYTMTYRRAYRIGDRVKIQNTIGDVTQMRLLVTHLRSTNNEEIVIPNSIILNSEVINYTTLAHEQGVILHTTVGIGYDEPWRQVEAMLLMAAQRTPGALREPPPFVVQKELRSFDIEYELKVYCAEAHNMVAIYSQLHRNILDVFNEYGVQIMTPAYERDPSEPKVVPEDRWFSPPASTKDSD